ncbi:MAG: hypothetical protein Q8Q09_18900 [Deltaproteobacteria bacterium]|nr:hypothetical protein [Deltaproteobacteria bacterium]
MLTSEQLQRLERECDTELTVPPDTAEALEEAADRLHRFSGLAERQRDAAPSKSSVCRAGGLDRIVDAIDIRLIEDCLPSELLGLFSPYLSAIIIGRALGPPVRTPTLAHQTSHAFRPRAPSDETRYLMLAILIPRVIVQRLGGHKITELALIQACPWHVPYWVAATRAAMLRRMLAEEQ